jgi:hypothetical protein
MEPPAGYNKYLPDEGPAALHCLKSICSMEHPSRLQHGRLSMYLKGPIFDKCVFVKGSGANIFIVATWVDGTTMANARGSNTEREQFDRDPRKGCLGGLS